MAILWRVLLNGLVLICIVSIKYVNSTIPPIFWDPYHPLFQCEDPIINVKRLDLLRFICPDVDLSRNPNADEKSLYETISLLNDNQENNYSNCDSTVRKGILTTCQAQYKVSEHSIIEFAPTPTSIAFSEGKTYYAVATSYRTASQLHNRVGGSCNTTESVNVGKLRLKIRVCTAEEISNGNCKLCETEACLYQDCRTSCSNWTVTENYEKGGQCYRVEKRSCNKTLINEVKEERQDLVTDCRLSCSNWTETEIYEKGGQCYRAETRSCNKTLINDVREERRDLIIVCEKHCSSWTAISYHEKDGSCSEVRKRLCNNTQLALQNVVEYREVVTGCRISNVPTGAPNTGSSEDDDDTSTYKILLGVISLIALLIGMLLGGCIYRHHHKKNQTNDNADENVVCRNGRNNTAYTASIIANDSFTPTVDCKEEHARLEERV